jgi:hypothetical protein
MINNILFSLLILTTTHSYASNSCDVDDDSILYDSLETSFGCLPEISSMEEQIENMKIHEKRLAEELKKKQEDEKKAALIKSSLSSNKE